MARRPVFFPSTSFPFFKEVNLEFEWFPGFAKTQFQKSIASLHMAAAREGIKPVLEISSKSPEALGVAVSAFNIKLLSERTEISVECAFQGSKVFEKGGPYTDLYNASSKEAKTDKRLRTSGTLIAFSYFGEDFPTKPLTAFYDWLYIKALVRNPRYSQRLFDFNGFTDIAFNPHLSINCQAHSAALFIALSKIYDIEHIAEDKRYFISLVSGESSQSQSSSNSIEQLSFPF